MPLPTRRRLVILGATGSIGRQALEVVAAHPDRLEVVGLSAGANVAALRDLALAFPGAALAVADEAEAHRLTHALGRHVGHGLSGMVAMAGAPDVDVVLVGVSGALGLAPTLAAIRAGRKVAFANKETLVAAGDVVMGALARSAGAELWPVDSEHSALWQCLRGEPLDAVRKVVLTASGGALRDRPVDQLEAATVDQVLAHPTWPAMGRKITVDSANLMNKALEVIEAQILFGLPVDRVEVRIHPQSAVHGLVEFRDGSVKAQIGPPDMRMPIQVALLHPDRPESPWPGGSWTSWEFRAVDPARYPALALGYEAGRAGRGLPAVLNAANEVAAARFLAGDIPFGAIVPMVRAVMERHQPCDLRTEDEVWALDAWARAETAAMTPAIR
ncbi:MAG: 1-deoxy-D-xylulose-5-phosphate reductoisomerase [Candidatus Sericytochromatia bacterium]|nr:1-deoxy-D-xylulose-5-phosphate reductoisomerase [Candidatus Sericytochromatia bacterium]